MRKNIYAVIDTETVGIKKKLVYDLGMVITDKTGDIKLAKRWLVKEVMDIPLMEELPFYNKKIEKNAEGIIPTALVDIETEINEIFAQFDVNVVVAYNLPFDFQAVKDTMSMFKIESKLFDNLEYFDLWNASCNSFLNQKNYKAVAREQGWFTKTGLISSNAENAYRYITGDYQFVEEHTALEDCIIETRILQEICRQKKAKQKNTMIYMPWKKIQEKRSA